MREKRRTLARGDLCVILSPDSKIVEGTSLRPRAAVSQVKPNGS